MTTRKPSAKDNGNKKKDSKPDSKSQSKKPKASKPSKIGGFFMFMIKLVIFIVLIGVCYYGYYFYQEYQKNGGDAKKSLEVIKGRATQDYSTAADNTKKYSEIAYKNASEFSAEAYEKSAEYAATVKEFSKESFADLSATVKKIGEKTPDELSADADSYLKEFMKGSESKPFEKVEHVPVEQKGQQKKEPAETTTPEVAKNKKEDPTKEGFVVAEKLNDSKTTDEPKPIENKKVEPKIETKIEEPKTEEPKNKGFKKVGENIGDKNEKAITKQPEESKPQPGKITTQPPATEPPHMKTYREGRGYFLEGLIHYKKQMPGMPNEHVHRKKAYALFKKASVCFSKVDSKMQGEEEFDRISNDNNRYMFGCGKSMLIDKH